jgi:subtilisin family serine protease
VRTTVIASETEESGRWRAPIRRRPSLTLGLTALLFLATPAFAGIVNRDVEREVRERGSARVIVMMRDDAMPSLTSDDFTLTTRWHAVTGFAGVARASAIAKLESDPNVASVELDLPGGAQLAQSVPMIGGDVVHAMGYTGNVTVAILDSGIDLTHPDLADSIVDQQCFCSSGCCPNGQSTQSGSGAARDEDGHGTNVAGIIASKGRIASIGVAPGVKIVAVRVLDKNNRFSGLSQIISGLQWVLDNHPEVRVINASLGTDQLFSGYCDGQSPAMAHIVDQLRAHGTMLFVSSGNQASSTSMGSPACVQNTISVGAVYDGDDGSVTFPQVCTDATTHADQITCFTNSNSTLDLLGPGAVITSTGLGGGLSSYIGTSQATPHCAGAAAILLTIRPSLTADEVETILKTTGRPLVDSRNAAVIPRLNLLAAVQSVVRIPQKRHSAR